MSQALFSGIRALGLVLCGLAAPAVGWGQTALFPPAKLARIQEGLTALYSLEHDRAIEIYRGMIDKSADDPAGYTYLAKTYWLQELVTKQELSIDRFASSDFFAETPKYRPEVSLAAENQFLVTNEQAIEKARARLEADPDDSTSRYLLGLAHQNRASFEASLKRSWWSSFRAGTKTFRYHKQLLDRDPKLYDAYLSIGVFHYVTGRLGWNVKWLAFLLGYRGSTERGKEELRLATEKASLSADDARVVLILIHTREKQFQEAFDDLSVLLNKYPKNYLVHLDMGGIALLMDRPGAAIAIYEDILRKVEARAPKYRELEHATVANRLGVAFRQQGDLATSADWFRRALADADRTELSQIVSHLELGKTYDRMGRRSQAVQQYERVVELQDFAGSRLEAREYLKQPFRGD